MVLERLAVMCFIYSDWIVSCHIPGEVPSTFFDFMLHCTKPPVPREEGRPFVQCEFPINTIGDVLKCDCKLIERKL